MTEQHTSGGGLRPLTLEDARAVSDMMAGPGNALAALNGAGARLAVTSVSLIEWLAKMLIKRGHAPRGNEMARLLELASLPGRKTDDLRRLALGGAQDRENFHTLFGPVCRVLGQCEESQREILARDLMGWALTNTMGTGAQKVHPVDDPEHPFLDYLALVSARPTLMGTLSERWAYEVLNEDQEYGMGDRSGSLWALDQLLSKGVAPGKVLLDLLDLEGHEEDERYWMAQLLDRNALLDIVPSQLALNPGRPWREEMVYTHPTSWRNRLLNTVRKTTDEGRTPKMRL